MISEAVEAEGCVTVEVCVCVFILLGLTAI